MSEENAPLYVSVDNRVSLHVRDLTVVLKRKGKDADQEKMPIGKQILQSLNMDLDNGEVMAILGSSGSGKTTLLNTLSGRLPNNGSSPFEFNGMIHYTPSQPQISYLLQEDSFNPGLTVYELLNFTAQLKLHESSHDERQELINLLIDALALTKIRDTIVNDFHEVSTLSGGEKRRVSLALQLLTKPSLLFLDEPTTGLDSTSSISLISLVKQLSVRFGITVILTIHQPRVEIIDLFDKICVLAKGGAMIYYGSLSDGVEYFKSLVNILGVVTETNFADFLLRISSVDKYNSAQVEIETQKRVEKLTQIWSSTIHYDTSIELRDTFNSGNRLRFKKSTFRPCSFFLETEILFRRTLLLTVRDYKSIMMLIGVNTIISIVVGWIFFKPDKSLAGIRTLTSSLYVSCEVVGFTPLMYEVERLSLMDGKYLLKEYKNDHLYSLKSWFTGRKLAKLLLEDIPVSLLWSIITYFMWGLHPTMNFGIYFFNVLLIYDCGIALAHFCFVFGGYQLSMATLAVNVVYQFQNLACGYFVNAKHMPVYVRWTKYLVSFWYSFGSLVSNYFTGFQGDCIGSVEECYEYSGSYVLADLGFPENWKAVPFVVNLVWFLFMYSVSALLILLRMKLSNIKVVKERKSTSKIQEVPQSNRSLSEQFYSREPLSSSGPRILLKGIHLDTKQTWRNKIISREFVERKLLDDLNIQFLPGLNAIMGPSGSGKTTLLNLITGRTNFSNLNLSGEIEIDNTVVNYRVLSKLTSYVVQDDSSLIPTLTVRETLWYQAKLRLEPKRQPHINYVVNEIMKKVGLLDVQNLPVGDAVTKGISGGEKRRLSLAIQLLNEHSKILLLDEPTSGLDSFTSQNLIQLLKELATEESKIIILTIHQPKFEIFQMFDKIVLLKNGELIYAGVPAVLTESIEFNSPISNEKSVQEEDGEALNFADYLMDILIDPKHESQLNNLRAIPEQEEAISQHGTKLEKLTQVKPQRLETFKALLSRQFKTMVRSDGVLMSRTIQYIALAVVHTLYYAPLKHSAASISNRLGLAQQVINFYFIGSFNSFAYYPIERNTFYKDHQDNLYSTLQFMLAYLFIELPLEIGCSFIMAMFYVMVIGLRRTSGMFFTTWLMFIIVVNTGESVSIISMTIFDHMGVAINALSNIMALGIFMGGTMSLDMPQIFKAFNYISPLKYVVLAVVKIAFEGQEFACGDGVQDCNLSTGSKVLDQYGLDSILWKNYLAVVLILVIYRIVAYLLVLWKVNRR